MTDESGVTSPGTQETTISVMEEGAVKPEEGGARSDVSALAIGRMLGLAGSSELKLLESKIDLLSTRVNSLTVRMEKVLTAVAKVPTAVDLERIDVQIGALKTVVRDAVKDIEATLSASVKKAANEQPKE